MESEELLFPEGHVRAQKPEVKLQVPEALTEEVYLKMLKKIFACIRFQVYSKIRHLVREKNQTHISRGQLT